MKKHLKALGQRILADKKILITLAAVLLIYYFVFHKILEATCPLVFLTGFPCPGCGLTRAAVLLFKFDFKGAYEMNPSIYIVVFLVLWIIITRYVLGKNPKVTTYILIAAILLAVGIYIRRMALYFPNRSPYVYMYDNVILNTLKKIR